MSIAEANGWISSGLCKIHGTSGCRAGDMNWKNDSPSRIVKPKHGRTFLAKITLRCGHPLFRGPRVQYSFVDAVKDLRKQIEPRGCDFAIAHLMFFFPSVIFNVSLWPPKLIEPPAPPTLRQIEQTQIYSVQKSSLGTAIDDYAYEPDREQECSTLRWTWRRRNGNSL